MLITIVAYFVEYPVEKFRCTHSEVELRKCCLGQSEKSEIPYNLINMYIYSGLKYEYIYHL
jgi:hypothetical protein